jgi:carbon storage regulator
MLVLSRKVGERIVVPEYRLSITIVAIEGSKVRLGISAPPEVAVHREEVWRQIQEGQVEGRFSGHPRATKVEKGADPFFITVFHDGGDNHEFDDEVE